MNVGSNRLTQILLLTVTNKSTVLIDSEYAFIIALFM